MMEADLIESSDPESDEEVTSSTPAVSSLAPGNQQHSAEGVALTFEFATGNICRQVEPPQHETMERTFPTLSFPNFDAAKLQPIKISMSFASTRLSSTSHEPHPNPSHIKLAIKSPPSSRSLIHVSTCSSRLKAARRRSLSNIGIPSWSDERKLFSAVRSNDLCTVIRLLDDGINPNISDSKKRTALHIAASQGLDLIVSALTARRADPNRIDILGNSPLHLAACRGDTRVVRILIGAGADIYKRDTIGRTPLDIVKSRLNTLRQDKSISTDKLIGECQMICDVLRIHGERLPRDDSNQVDTLCNMMAHVSTREQADECAEAMLNQMSSLSLKHSEKVELNLT